ncbi:hypothetical protein PHMEG_00033279, partial [Phytophthora megakarya]
MPLSARGCRPIGTSGGSGRNTFLRRYSELYVRDCHTTDHAARRGLHVPELGTYLGTHVESRTVAAQNSRFMSDASFLWGLLTAEQVAWNEIARGRHYSVRRDDAPFQTLDPEVASAFPVEVDGDTLMLTLEERELRWLAHVRPRDWSESDASGPEPKRRRGSTDATLSVPSWPGSDEATRVWGGSILEVVGTSSEQKDG